MAMVVKGISCVWGIPSQINGVSGVPCGAQIRYRFRNDDVGRVYVRHNGTTACYPLKHRCNKLSYTCPWELIPQAVNNRSRTRFDPFHEPSP